MHTGTARTTVVLLLALTCLGTARQASAELVFFSADRVLSVKGHRFDGDSIIVSLRNGGEMTFDRALVAKITPDEVPYDEPAAMAESIQAMPAAQLVESPIYDPLIARASTQYGVDVRLVKALIQVESAYRARARSPKSTRTESAPS